MTTRTLPVPDRCSGYPLVVAERQAAGVERLDDLVDRLLAEVRDRVELRLGLRHEIADGLDPGPLQAVVRPHAELELLDQYVLERIRLPRGSAAGHPWLARLERPRHAGLAELHDPVGDGEDRQLRDQDLGG